jgi:hypothetical protein
MKASRAGERHLSVPDHKKSNVEAISPVQEDPMAKRDTISKAASFLKTFREKHGAVTCNELLGVERGTEEGERRLKEEGLVREMCPGFGRDAATILEQLPEAGRS